MMLDSQKNTMQIFIGSSVRGLEIAKNVKDSLNRLINRDRKKLRVILWDDYRFQKTVPIYTIIKEILNETHFAIIIFTADDIRIKMKYDKQIKQPTIKCANNIASWCISENVIYEFGLFTGKLGEDRVFVIEERDNNQTVELCSDLKGLLTNRVYKLNNNIDQVCKKIYNQIKKIYDSNRKICTIDFFYNTDYLEDIFIENLIKCDKITIIDMGKKHLLTCLENALKQRKNKSWKELNIIFPCRKVFSYFQSLYRNTPDICWEDHIVPILKFYVNNGIKGYCKIFRGTIPFEGELYEFDLAKNDFIRIAPLFSIEKQYYTELRHNNVTYADIRNFFAFISNRANPLLQFYIGLRNIRNINDILGNIQNKLVLIEQNIQKNKEKNLWLPVSLIFLYGENDDGKKCIILQQRTKFNASDAIGKYALLSEKIIDEDFFTTFDRNPSDKYKNLKNELPNNLSKIKRKFTEEIPCKEISNNWNKIFKIAAKRGLKEKLGLENIDDLKITSFGSKRFYIVKHEKFNLFVKVFSYEIDFNTFGQILDNRKYSCLEHKTLEDIKELKESGLLNKFLDTYYDEVVSIAKELSIN